MNLTTPESRAVFNDAKSGFFALQDYVPHEKQALIHNSTARFIVAICGRRFGKSLLAAREVEALCHPSLPNKRIWVVAPTYRLVDKVFREIWKDCITGRSKEDPETKEVTKIEPLFMPAQIEKKSENDHYIKFIWGTEIVGVQTKNEDGLVGDELDLLILDEAARIKQRVWDENLRPALTSRYGRAIFITTPRGKNWIYDLYKDSLIDDDEWEAFKFKTAENPHGGVQRDLEKAKKKLPTQTYLQEYEADFITYVGQVYKGFDLSTHVVSELPEKFNYYIGGLDYGFVNPSVFVLIGVHDGRYYVIAELHKEGLTSEELASEIKAILKDHKITLRSIPIYADHEPAATKTLQNNGLYVINGKKDVKAGIDKINEKMKIQSDGKPLIMFHASCKKTIKEHEDYHYAESKDDRNDKEEPVKDHDHSCDALRYAIFTRETAGTVARMQVRGLY
jgi:PBSX family phage terminase large subunit